MRLDKFLSDMKIEKRSKIKKLLKEKEVTVNGEIVTDRKIIIDEFKDIVKYKENEIKYRKYVYLMLNKPAGVISATKDRNKTVIDLLDDKYQDMGIFPMGRLDQDTVGLLILTNDGVLSHNILSPKKHIDKTYYVIVNGKVENKHIELFKKGIVIDGNIKCMPATLKILKSEERESEIELVIKEGKYHQVKRMVEAINLKVTYLKRIKMGKLNLDDTLKEGMYRELTEEEISLLEKR